MNDSLTSRDEWENRPCFHGRRDSKMREWQLAGLPALKRFAQLAADDDNHGLVCRHFLLSFYEGLSPDFDLASLRELPSELQEDALAIIRLDWCGAALHTYLPDGHLHLDQWAGEDISQFEPQ